jgi:hypothetical protein
MTQTFGTVSRTADSDSVPTAVPSTRLGRSSLMLAAALAVASCVSLVSLAANHARSARDATDASRAAAGPSSSFRASDTVAVRLANSEWDTGMSSANASVEVELTVLPNGCLAGRTPHGVVALVWPAGYRAARTSNGLAEAVNAHGETVAREGQRLGAGGGMGLRTGAACEVGTNAGPFYIQQDLPLVSD